MTLIITSNPDVTNEPSGRWFRITADAEMPEITVTAALQGQGLPDRAEFTWSATLIYDGVKHTEHPAIGPYASANPSWRIPFTHVRGGKLTVQVVMRAGGRIAGQASMEWDVVGTNPINAAAIRRFTDSIGANRAAFRKLIRQESSLQQFRRATNLPLYSNDGQGGVGLCQLTVPPPTADQIWSWKANVRGGWRLYQEKERIARHYLNKERDEVFPALRAAWHHARIRQRLPAPPVELPNYTQDQLERDTLRGYNGYAGDLHEYRLRRNPDRTLYVTVNGSGTRGTAEWEQVPVAERRRYPGDTNYVNHVLALPDL